MPIALNESIAAHLAEARDSIMPSEDPPRIGWAWMMEEYRVSSERAFRGPNGSLTVGDGGIAALETAISELLRDQNTRTLWREEDIWTTVLSLLGAAALNNQLDLLSAVRKIRRPEAVRSVAAIANVSWASAPQTFGNFSIAALDKPEQARDLAAFLKVDGLGLEAIAEHSVQLHRAFGPHVLATSTSPRQGEFAHSDFARELDDLIGLTLLFAPNLNDFNVLSRRGSTNRPGMRGLALDRGALAQLLSDKGSGELAASVLSIAGWGGQTGIRWYSASPMPLDQLLAGEAGAIVGDLLRATDAIAQRLRVAARWYARSFWSDADDDAALALSVALDSLLTGKDAVPGAVSKGRFALLERDPAHRAERFRRYDEVYQVRNAIAHGGDGTRRLEAIGGANSMLEDARWVAEKLLELRRVSKPLTDKAFRELWDGVQWGTVEWASPRTSA